jgi:hypothetical protein
VLDVSVIANKAANDVVETEHYLHRRSAAIISFGLFEGLELVGVAIYGKPASPSLCSGVCGKEESLSVIELTRLWVADAAPKNTESWFLAQTFKMLPKKYDVLVSFAEPTQGHVGTIYQATNWLYTGLSARRALWSINGDTQSHARHRFDNLKGEELKRKITNGELKKYYRKRKFRYVKFLGNKNRKKELMSRLKYETKSYPKLNLGDNGAMLIEDYCDSCQEMLPLFYVSETENYHCKDCV